MDTLTHGLAGILLGGALPSTGDEALDLRLRRREMLTGFATAMLPDADALVSPFSAEFYITQHRGLSHSFPLLPFWAILLGWLFWLSGRWFLRDEDRGPALRRLIWVSGLGVLSHILLDWITSWGTMFLSPLSWARYQLDWLFIIDFVLSGTLVAGLFVWALLARRGPRIGRLVARGGLLVATLYILFCGLKHREALEVVRGSASTSLQPAGRSVAAIPQPFSPWRWLLLSDDGRAVTVAFLDLGKRGPDPSPRDVATLFERTPASIGGFVDLVKSLAPAYRSRDDLDPRVLPKSDSALADRVLGDGVDGIFGRFARFPVASSKPLPEGITSVMLRDARFGYLSPAIDPFVFVARFDGTGRLVSSGFPSPRWR